jgi:acetolactate synthase small subunit
MMAWCTLSHILGSGRRRGFNKDRLYVALYAKQTAESRGRDEERCVNFSRNP